MSKVKVYSRGCVFEKAKIYGMFELGKKYGIEQAAPDEKADVHLIITCLGTGPKIMWSLNAIEIVLRDAKEDEKVIIVGCFNKKYDSLKDLDGIKNIRVIEEEDWPRYVINEITGNNKKITEGDITVGRMHPMFNNDDGTPNDIVIKFMIENGCINGCSFCKNNYIKSPAVKSVSEDVLLKYFREKIASGTKQIILGGENTTLYGIDLYGKRTLHSLIRKLSEEEGLEYISVDELTIKNMYPELFAELLNNPKVTSVQFQLESASDKILKLMNRGHTIEEYDDYISQLKEKGKYVGTILMSGYPEETYEDLDKTIEYMRKRNIYTILVSQYEDYPELPSSGQNQLSDIEKRKHTGYLVKAMKENNHRLLLGDMQTIETAIFITKFKGCYIFSTPNTCVFGGQSRKKEFNRVEPGTVLKIKPKDIIKYDDATGSREVYRF